MAQTPARPRSPLLTERRPALPPAPGAHGPQRRLTHLICFLVFMALPFTNVMRFDLPRMRFYIVGFEIWISEFSILFFAMMFLMFMLAASAIVYGRIYCGYLCPQMIFSEWSVGWERRVDKLAAKHLKGLSASARKVAAKLGFLGSIGLGSVLLAFIFTSYFIAPLDLLRRLSHFDLVTAGGITGAVVTLLTMLDFTLVRHKFCTTVCPYGYIQGMLTDKHTLLVAYQDPGQVCIDCKKCVQVCEMGIDIRESPYQIECVHCGDCVDACEEVLRKLGHGGLIHYAWGDRVNEQKESWLKRIGLRDAKRFAILLLACCYLTALGVTLALRKPVLIRVAADRTTAFSKLPDGRIENRVRLNLANRSSKPQAVKVWVEGLANVELALAANPIELKPGESLEQVFALRAPLFPGSSDVNPIRVCAQASDQKKPEVTEMSFIMPYTGAN